MGKEAEGKDRDEQQRVVKPTWWPTRVRDLTPAGVGEIVRRTRRVAKLMIDAASEEVLITDTEIRKHKSIYIRRELIAAKITAWEWFFGPWLGLRPRLSLEEVCPVLHMEPEWIRECVRQAKTGGRWVDGYMDGDTRVYGRMVGGEPIKPTRYSLPPGYRVAELYHEGEPFTEDEADGNVDADAAGEGQKRRRRGSQSRIVPPPPPERIEAARVLARNFDEGPKPPALLPEEEIAQVLRLGLDLLGDADVGVVLSSSDD